MERITSRDNQRLIQARKVRDGLDKSAIFIEGKRLADEAIKSGIKISECFVSEAFNPNDMVDRIEAPVFQLSEKIFKSIADTDSPQGLILIAERPTRQAYVPRDLPIDLFLNEINNPSNLGAILRTAEAAGVERVILSRGSADPFSPKALRASMGSAFRVAIREGECLQYVVAAAGEQSTWVAGVDINGATEYTNFDWAGRGVLVFGSEAHGLSKDELLLCDDTIRIPMAAGVESLNLATSVAVILFEARKALFLN
ncbi:MAG: RNA methyltransferase [Acidobacteria bacterium]|nr:RNA methyltransferase [Acidobacteriota bacterium]